MDEAVKRQLDEVYERMASDPKFAKHDYEKQKKIRAYATAEVLKGDQQFLELADGAKGIVIDKLSAQRPVFQNAHMGNTFGDVMKRAEKGTLEKADVSVIAGNNGALNNSLLSNVLARGGAKLAKPIAELTDRILGTNNAKYYEWENLMDGYTGEDGDKLLTYINEQASRNGQEKIAGQAQGAQALGSVSGFIADFALFHGSWAGLTSKAVSKTSLSLATKLPGKLGTWTGKVALPAAVSATSSGSFGVVREQLLSMFNEDESRRQDSVKKIAKTFGSWAALDFAVNVALGTVMPHLAGVWRRAFGKAKRVKIGGKKYSPDQINNLIDQSVQGTAPEDLLGQMDPTTRRYILGQADIRRAAENVDDAIRLRPYDDLALEGNAAGMTVYRDPSEGTYYIYKPRGGRSGIEVDIEETKDLITAKRIVGKGLKERAAELSGEARDEFVRLHKSSMQYGVVDEILDGSLDPEKVRGMVGPKEYEILKSSGRTKDFISPVDRPYVGANEAQRLQEAFAQQGYVKTVKSGLSDEAIERLSKGQGPFASKAPVDVIPDEGGTEVLVMVRNPANAKAIEKATLNAQKAIEAGSPETFDTLRNMYLMEAGFDGIVDTASGQVRAFYPDKLRVVATKFDPNTGRIGEISAVPTEEPAIRDTVKRAYKGMVGAKQVVHSPDMIANVAGKLKGRLNKDIVQRLSRMVLSEHGVDANKVTVKVGKFTDALDDPEYKGFLANARINKGQVTIEVPGSISTPKVQRKFLKELFSDEFQNVIDTLGGTAKKVKIPAGAVGKKSAATFTSPYKSAEATEKWLRSSVEDIAKGKFSKTAKGYVVELPGKTPIEAADLGELTDRLMLEMIDPAYLRFDMAKRGYKLTTSEGLITVRGKGLDSPVTGRSINEVADRLNYRPEKISSTFAPRVTLISDEAAEVSFESGVAVGSRRSIKKLLNNFEDMDKMARLKHVHKYNDGDVFLQPNGSYEVRMPEYGIIREFDNAKEAHRFVRSTWKEFSSLEDIAHRKGLQMWREGPVFKLSDGSNTFTAKSRDELYRIFKDYPDASGGKELLPEVDPDTLNTIDSVLYKYSTAQIPVQDGPPVRPLGAMEDASKPLKPMGASGELRALIDNMDHWAEVTLKKMGADDILRKYRNIETAYRATRTEVTKAERALNAIFTDKNGKILPLERRKAIFYHSGAQTADEQFQAVEMFGELSGEEKVVVENLRKLLGGKEGDVVTGLAGKFGISPDKFVNNYMPRIMDWSARNAKRVAEMNTAEELIEEAMKAHYGSAVPKKLKAFFQNMRTSEVLNFTSIDDPIKALQHYFRVGYRQMYMGRAWEELYDVLGKAGVDEGVVMRFNRYRETLMGMNTVEGMKNAKRIGKALGAKMGIKGGEHMMETYFSLNYFANMGYRPWLALRNTFQVFTTLAPRMGNTWVDDAIKTVSKYSDDQYKYLEQIGVIPNQPPIVNTVLDADSFVGKLVHKSLGMFKSSDEYTRAIAFETARTRFNFALEKWRKGGIKNIDGFLKEAGVTKMDDDTIREVRRLVTKGDLDSMNSARARFGTQLSEETMFSYRQSQSPTAFTGSFWGRIFGQYGTYSAGYRALILRGLKNGSFADKAAFSARFLANQTALYASFKALGIDARNFIPGSPALFGGGPQFEVGVALAQAMGTTYKGKQARSILARKFSPITGIDEYGGLKLNYPEMMPGSIQLRYAQKALEYFEQGDLWRGFLAMTTTPVTDPYE